jgi:hypothetical protein
MKKSKLMALGLSFVLASAAGWACAGDTYYSPNSETGGCAAAEYSGNNQYWQSVYYAIPDLENGATIQLQSDINYNGQNIGTETATFQCENGYLTYWGMYDFDTFWNGVYYYSWQ